MTLCRGIAHFTIVSFPLTRCVHPFIMSFCVNINSWYFSRLSSSKKDENNSYQQNIDLLANSASERTRDNYDGTLEIEPYISFLGTASAIPSKYRNVTGIHLRFKQGGGMLLDTGEATWQQLIRLHTSINGVSSDSSDHNGDMRSLEGLEKEVVKDIDIIWISHPHADHHLGLIRVLAEKKKLISSLDYQKNNEDMNGGKVLLIAPPAVLAFLRDYSRLDPSIADSYVPLSNRLLDDFDSCTESGNYHLHNLHQL